ncbi:MAG: right-handed parallel beta-helix repeat-containing protein [Flavobacteriales bacterium]|nr:right-handed parallel beta-helix repeat-containing protein [Flavobacteriales bacterium]
MKRLITLSLLAAIFSTAQATNFHIAHDGNDANVGTSSTAPWKTIARMMQSIFTLQPGDQILFKRGGTYEGNLEIPLSGTTTQHIVVGAYGTGNAPIISGSKAVTAWTVHSGNIWKATVAEDVKQVFVGGVIQKLARWPNTGWLTNDNGTMTSMTDASITQASGYWAGARLVIRSSNWSYDCPTITGHTGSTITFGSVYSNLAQFDWGYYLCNKLSELDMAGEWYYNPDNDQLYLWAPNNANPNGLSVRAQIREKGITIHANIHHVDIQNLAFEHQNYAGVSEDGGYNNTVTGCTFSDLYKAAQAYCHDSQYSNNTILRTQGTGLFVIGNNNLISNNTFQDIALIPGNGESTWGYIGLRANGSNSIVRNNRLTNIGYIGIAYEGQGLIEKNVIMGAMASLNDGGGIAFDNCNGLIIQDNIVDGMVGNIESSAPDFPAYKKICHGIYFGDSDIQNTTVQRNIVGNCAGSGIHVDHTMLSTGNQVKDNVLFNNEIQMSIGDASNYNGAGAVAPFHLSNFNDIYSGNTMYCLKKEQWCVLQLNVYGNNPVDFGTFTNNRYFNPWNEASIWVHNTFAGTHTYYTVEQLQQELGEDAGSTRSAQRLNAYGVTAELSGELVVNGTFNTNVTGWGGWPTNATATRDLTYLDNGALKAHIPNNSLYNVYTVRNPDQFAIANGQWYRMKFSLQSSGLGFVLAGTKGNSQLTGPNNIHQTRVPFSPERREVELIFQSNLGDNAMVQFVNEYTDPMYWIDNVSVKRVSVSPIDPAVDHKLFYNDQATASTVTLPAGCWSDVNGNLFTGTMTLQPFTGKVLFYYTGSGCAVVPPPAGGTLSTKVFLGGPLDWTANLMSDALRVAGIVPMVEPYTGLGWALANTAATIQSSMLQVTGPQAIVDWVILELRNPDAGYTLSERRAALVRRNGEVIGTDGNAVIAFTVATAGKYLVLRHRNHLGVMAAAPIATNGQLVDFSAVATALYGTQPAANDGVKHVLWVGDSGNDGLIKYTGTTNDRDPILTAVGGLVPTAVLTGQYRKEDVNMDGVVKYVGTNNDRDLVLTVVGGTVPTAVRVAQLP